VADKNVKFLPVDEQLAYLRKGVAEIIREEDLKAKLEASAKSGKPLRAKLGVDPPRRTFTWATPWCCAS
jgi:tyrosyl-tRNA synthetase